MNVSSWLEKASKKIDRLDAELFLMEVLRKEDRSELVLCAEQDLTRGELDALHEMLMMRKEGLPVAYVIGKKEFYGREFYVDPNVLIPRPETETMIDVVKEILADWKGDVSEVSIADVGTGSGCIAITLALETNVRYVLGIDLWMEALMVARYNIDHMGAKNVHLVDNDLLDSYPPDNFDIVVANLPYVDRDWDWTSPELEYEPQQALYAGKGGLELIYRLIDQCGAKYLVLEADPSQHKKIIDYAKKHNYELVEKRDFILAFTTA